MLTSLVPVFGIIYMFTNRFNGKKYVGQTVFPLLQRVGEHFRKANNRRSKTNVHFQNALRKNGREGFEISVLCSCGTQEELNLMEDSFIVLLDTMNPQKGYNLKRGGLRGKVSDLTKQRVSAARRGERNGSYRPDIPSTEELARLYAETKSLAKVGELVSASWGTIRNRLIKAGFKLFPASLGRPLTEEHKLQISRQHKGEKGSKYRHDVLTADLVRMYTTDLMSTPQIAEKFSMTARGVALRLKEAGVSLRSVKEAKILRTSPLSEVG